MYTYFFGYTDDLGSDHTVNGDRETAAECWEAIDATLPRRGDLMYNASVSNGRGCPVGRPKNTQGAVTQ